jgi:hypothetical protein
MQKRIYQRFLIDEGDFVRVSRVIASGEAVCLEVEQGTSLDEQSLDEAIDKAVHDFLEKRRTDNGEKIRRNDEFRRDG